MELPPMPYPVFDVDAWLKDNFYKDNDGIIHELEKNSDYMKYGIFSKVGSQNYVSNLYKHEPLFIQEIEYIGRYIEFPYPMTRDHPLFNYKYSITDDPELIGISKIRFLTMCSHYYVMYLCHMHM